MVKRNLLGKLEFYDDDPLELDCGCTAYPGDEYQEFSMNVLMNDKSTKKIKFTFCGEDECFGRCVSENLSKGTCSLKMLYIKTSRDEYNEYQDYLGDRD